MAIHSEFGKSVVFSFRQLRIRYLSSSRVFKKWCDVGYFTSQQEADGINSAKQCPQYSFGV